VWKTAVRSFAGSGQDQPKRTIDEVTESIPAVRAGRVVGAVGGLSQDPGSSGGADELVTVRFTARLSDTVFLGEWVDREGVNVAELIRRALVTERYVEDQQLAGAKVVVHRGLRQTTMAALGRTVHSEAGRLDSQTTAQTAPPPRYVYEQSL